MDLFHSQLSGTNSYLVPLVGDHYETKQKHDVVSKIVLTIGPMLRNSSFNEFLFFFLISDLTEMDRP